MILRLMVMFALIAAAVGLTEWLRDLQEDLRRAPDRNFANAPDYTFEEVVMTTMGIDGARLYRIDAPRMTHFATNDSARLMSPRVRYFRDDGPPVELRAQRAIVSAQGDRIWLPGEVDIVRPAHADRARLTVKTRDVRVFPEPEVARTDAPVRAASGTQRSAGTGMKLDLAAGTLDLQSRVHSTYAP